MASEQELSVFLRSVEKRAFKRAHFATQNPDSALDIVQESMIRLAEKYGDHDAAEWPLLFQRILTNAILDWHRRQKVRAGWMTNLSDFRHEGDDSDADFDLLETLEVEVGSGHGEAADRLLERAQTLEILETEIRRLPERQREAFLLRYWEGLDVAETAEAMGCSEGSVKTHCSRATQALAKALRARGVDHENR
ncbi:RNA polymerase sigma factor [Metallibacterium scheffleri]|uniref:RNA polymerase sigma factor n=1 Tax=Metallibacterium scheffleri TaxID=993689 RepID=UPI0026F0E406|nr:RNA polymerase sigma factor [Metallibacterium scheffleri]MBW8074676.1 RNA polymerase sigma factor [Metallibacterium scheffleri]